MDNIAHPAPALIDLVDDYGMRIIRRGQPIVDGTIWEDDDTHEMNIDYIIDKHKDHIKFLWKTRNEYYIKLRDLPTKNTGKMATIQKIIKEYTASIYKAQDMKRQAELMRDYWHPQEVAQVVAIE